MPSDWETSDMCNHMKGILEKVAELEKVLGYSDTKSKLLDSFSDLYKYLDSISLLQETALFNILLLLLILLSLFSVVNFTPNSNSVRIESTLKSSFNSFSSRKI